MAKNAAAATKRKKSNVKFWQTEGFQGYMFMIPTLIGFTFFVAYPVVVSIYYGFTDWDGVTTANWIGLDNFKKLFTRDPLFLTSLRLTFTYVIYTVPINLLLGLALAVLLNKTLPGIKIFRTLFYIPAITPSIASCTLWMFIFREDNGLLNSILTSIGLPAVGWLTSRTVALFSIGIIKFWACGSMMIIFLSGLQGVPVDVYEAADLDGAGGWTRFWKITFPMISPIFFLQLITGLIGAFQTFNEVAVMTEGGPSHGTWLMSYEIYQNAFNNYDFGYAIAEVWVLFAIIAFFTIIVFRSSDQYVYYESE